MTNTINDLIFNYPNKTCSISSGVLIYNGGETLSHSFNVITDIKNIFNLDDEIVKAFVLEWALILDKNFYINYFVSTYNLSKNR